MKREQGRTAISHSVNIRAWNQLQITLAYRTGVNVFLSFFFSLSLRPLIVNPFLFQCKPIFYLCTSFVLDEVWALESRASETKASQAHPGFELIWHDVLWGRADGRVEFAGIPSFSFPWVRQTETGSPRASEIKSQGPPQMWLPTQGNMACCCHCHFYSLVLHSLLPPTGLWDMIQIKLLTFASFFCFFCLLSGMRLCVWWDERVFSAFFILYLKEEALIYHGFMARGFFVLASAVFWCFTDW